MESLEDKIFIYLGRKGGLNDLTLQLNKSTHNTFFILSKYNESLHQYKRYLSVKTFSSLFDFIFSFCRMPFVLNRIFKFIKSEHTTKDVCFTGFHPWDIFLIFLLRGRRTIFYFIHDPKTHKGEKNLIIDFLQKRIVTDSKVNIVALSKYSFKVLSKEVDEKRLSIIELDSFFTPHNNVKEIKTDDKIILLFFGRIVKYKGFEKIPLLYEQLQHFPQYKFEIKIRGGGDKKIIAFLSRKLQNLCDLKFGWVETQEVAEIMKGNTIVVLPYDEATQSGIIPMAKSHGSTIIATPVGALPDQLRGYDNCVISADVTVEEIVKSIIKSIK